MYFNFLDVRHVNLIWHFLRCVCLETRPALPVLEFIVYSYFAQRLPIFYFCNYCLLFLNCYHILFLTNVRTDGTFSSPEVLSRSPERSHTWPVLDVRLVARHGRVTLAVRGDRAALKTFALVSDASGHLLGAGGARCSRPRPPCSLGHSARTQRPGGNTTSRFYSWFSSCH